MAENRVEIVVTSRNDTKAGLDSAKRDAETAGGDAGTGFSAAWDKRVQGAFSQHKLASWLDPAKRDAENAGDAAGQGFMARFMSHLTGGGGRGGGLGGLLSSAAPNLSGLPWGLGAGGGAGAAAIIPAAEAGLVEAGGLVAGIAAATAGIGAFGILSAGTFSQLKQDVSQYQAAWEKLGKAQDVQAVDPTKQHAAAVQKAQVNLQAVQLGMGQDAGPAAAAINTLRVAYDKLSASLAPLTFKVITDATKAVTTFLPNLLPFAQAGGQAIDGLLKHVTTFFQSADFKKWLDKFLPLVGPSITAIGDGIGKVMVAVGKLFTVMSAHDVVHAINIAFDIIAGAINVVTGVISRLMSNWDRMTGAFKEGWKNVTIWTREAEVFIARAALGILRAFIDAFGWIPGIGDKLRKAQADIKAFVDNVNNQLASIHDKTVTITMQTFYASPIAPGGSTYQSQVPHRAGGGPASGVALVGEFGPELVDLPGGSYVHPAGTFGGGGQPVVVQLQVNPSGSGGLDALFMSWLMKQIRNRGGGGPQSVQIALGQTH